MFRKTALLPVLLACVGLAAVPQAPASNPARSPEVLAIRARFNDVNARQAKLRKVEKSLSGISVEGAHLEVYFNGDRVEKLVLAALGESGRWETEYYFAPNELLRFVYEKRTNYAVPIGMRREDLDLAPDAGDQLVEARLYFVEERLFWWNTGAKPVTVKDGYPDKELEVHRAAYDLLRAAKMKSEVLWWNGTRYLDDTQP